MLDWKGDEGMNEWEEVERRGEGRGEEERGERRGKGKGGRKRGRKKEKKKERGERREERGRKRGRKKRKRGKRLNKYKCNLSFRPLFFRLALVNRSSFVPFSRFHYLPPPLRARPPTLQCPSTHPADPSAGPPRAGPWLLLLLLPPQQPHAADPLPHPADVAAAAFPHARPHVGVHLHHRLDLFPDALAPRRAEFVPQHVVAELPGADPRFRRIAPIVQRRLGREPVESRGHEGGDPHVGGVPSRDFRTDVSGKRDEKAQTCKLDSIARQREADGSSEGAGEGEPGKGGGGEEVGTASVVGTRNLVSGRTSELKYDIYEERVSRWSTD